MKKVLFILTALILTSCNDVEVSTAPAVVVKNQVEDKIDLSDPAVFAGSDFGSYFTTLYRVGKFDEMLAFTSKRSIDEHGKDAILDFYKNDVKLGYDIKLTSKTVHGDTTTLNYDANIIATKRVIRIDVVVENDSCKVLLPKDLKKFPG